MPILSLGISFRRAPIELLERLSFGDEDLTKAHRHVADQPGVEGAVILSTCNRVEVVAEVASYHVGFLALKRLLTETRGVGAEELAEPLYSHWERDAAAHLFGVASGLDSMVLGETQIQAQVREAAGRSEAEGTITPSLAALFHAAHRAGRRVRGETAIGAAPDAFVALATDLAAETLGGLGHSRIVVIGAGTMAAMAIRHLRERGVGAVRVLNRSLDHARALAERTGAEADDLEGLPSTLADADVVVSATGAAGLVVREPVVREAMAGRAGPLVLVDLAVPRDIEPGVAALDGVRLIDVVTLRDRIVADGGSRTRDLARAHEIVAEEVRRWTVRRRGDELAPLIRALRERGDRVVQAELDRRGARLADLTPEERSAVEALARAVAAKLLHDPIVELKERTEPGTGRRHARVLAELLGIDVDTLE